MGLSCLCDDDGDWWHMPPDGYSTIDTAVATRCCSCRKLIQPGETVNQYECYRAAETDEECMEYDSDGVPMADRYHCEECADMYWNLTALGFCVYLSDNMQTLHKEYVDEYVRRAR